MPLEHSRQEVATIVKDEDQALQRAIYKWIKFMQAMWGQITDSQEEKRRKGCVTVAKGLRVAVIVLSAAITTISDMPEIPRVVITVVAGLMTALTGIEAFFGFSERASSLQRQQREIQGLRDELRYTWMLEVELETDYNKRFAAAKRLLAAGPRSYNEILDKYTFKSKESQNAPEAT